MIKTVAYISSLLVFTASAQDLGIKAPAQSAPIAIINAAIYPVSSAPIEKGYIIFDKGRITAVGAGELTSPPAHVNIIDAGPKDGKPAKRVYPGLFSPYTQVGLTEIQALQQTTDITEVGRITPEVIAANAVNPDSTLLPVTRSNGVLTCAVFPDGNLISGQPSVIKLDGWTNPEVTVRQSIGIVVRYPNMRTFSAWWMQDGEEEQQRRVKADQEALFRVFDTASAYALAKDNDPSSHTDLRFEAMRPLFAAKEEKQDITKPGGTLFVHANTLDQLLAVASLAKKYNQRVVVIGGRDAPLCANVIKEQNIGVIVSGTHNLPQRDDSAYDESFTLPRRLHEKGIAFAISTSDDTAHERNLPYNAATAIAYGLDPAAALRCVTLQPAIFAGVDSELGSLEPGKAATLVVTDGDILEVMTRTQFAYIEGRAIDLSNKHTALAAKYRERYRQQKQELQAAPAK